MLYPILRRDRAPTLWDEVFNGRSEFDRFFDRWLGDRSPSQFGSWLPSVDVRETPEALLVQAELPGLRPDDVDVRVENGVLTISGEKKHEVEEGKEDASFHLVERRYGRFERSLTLPGSVNADDVKARFDSGVLTITLPKVEAARPRRIQIEAGNGISRK